VITSRTQWAVGAALVAVVGVLVGLAVVNRAPGEAERAPVTTTTVTTTTGLHITGLSVRGNQIVDQDGAPVRLLGFNHSGAEYACIEGWGIFDGPDSVRVRMTAGFVEQMAAWKGANTVRIPLNEQCWLGLGVQRAYGGDSYRNAIHNYVRLLREHGFIVVLDLHRSAPGDAPSENQEQMPDRDHSPTFWREVASAYRDDTGVVFDVFNEPFPFAESNTERAWQCWRDGGCQLQSQNGGRAYTAAGMAELVATIRATGARNVIAVGGIHWAERLDRWLEFRPADPLDNLIASFHNYAYNPFCVDERCYDTVLAEVVAAVPFYAGEVGPDATSAMGEECTAESVQHTGFSERILDWLDAHGASYTPWSWNAWDDCYSLISDYRGTPTPIWGEEVKARLARNAE
jgi:endoglucanase